MKTRDRRTHIPKTEAPLILRRQLKQRLAKLSIKLQKETEAEAKRSADPFPVNKGIHTVVKA
ncbi:MAG TPA: hypothetical protein VMA75_02400 [Candidatus Paceibacterota bacterium]|nr:hypothetical protein [Candidatus Paceibacterota bacterium]